MPPTSARSRLAAISSALLVALAFAAAPSGRALADGDGEGEGAGEGGGAATAPLEKPTLDGAIEQGDPRRRVSIKLPRTWKAADGFEPRGTCVALFIGPITEKSGGKAEIHVDPEFGRATLAVSSHFPGAAAADVRTGAGWAEAAGAASGVGGQALWCWERAIEKDGAVASVRIFSVATFKDEARELARQILDTAKAGDVPAKPAPPSGVSLRKIGDFDVWTDSDDKGKPGKLVEIVGPARDAAEKALKGKPFDESRPLLKAYQVGVPYMDALKATYGEAPDYGAFDPVTRSTFVQLYRMDNTAFPQPVREAAAQQYLVQYFGGTPPMWISVGLRRYAALVAQTGKPDKPPTAQQEGARTGIAMKSRRLDEWMDLSGGLSGAEANAAASELWAWHFFIRHGPGKKYAKTYQASLDALRQTGDIAASRKAWDGVDFAAMQTEFKEWAVGWK